VANGGGHFDDILAANKVEIMLVSQERQIAMLAEGQRAHMMTSAVLGWPICKLLGVSLVTTVHNAFERGAIPMGLGTHVIAVSAAVGRSMQARGCAIVATDVDGIPELLEHGKAGILVPPGNPARLSEALCSLVENPDSLQEWKKRSQFNIEHLRIERVAREILEVYAAASRQVRARL